MRILSFLIVVASLTGCASSVYQQHRMLVVNSMEARWVACVESAAWQWLDDRDANAPDEIKRARGSLTSGQMLVRSMDQCREFLSSNEIERWEQLNDSELRRFVREAEKRFFRVHDEIVTARELETI